MGLSLLGTRSSMNNGVGESKKNYISIHKVLEQTWRHFTSLKLCKCSQIPHSSPRVTSTTNRNTLNYATSLVIRLKESFQTPEVIQENLCLTSLPHSLDQHQKKKDKALDSPCVLILFSYTRN